MKIYLPMFFIICSILLFAIACEKTSEDKINPQADNSCDTINIKYSVNIVPILSDNCYRCHGAGSNTGSGGIVLEGYDNLLPYILDQKFFGNITHAPGFIPMPFDGGKLSDCDINKIRSWLDRGAINN